MIKLLIVVFSFFLIVGEGYMAEPVNNATKSQDGCTSCGTNSVSAQNKNLYVANSSEKPVYDSNDLDTAESRAASSATNDANSDQIDEIVVTGQRQKEEISVDKKTEQSNNILGLSDSDLRTGNVNQNTIATVIVNIINLLLGVAGTVAIFSLIYHAVQMQINSGITGDSSGVDKAKK